jgi:cold-inducible RNA-binding protein
MKLFVVGFPNDFDDTDLKEMFELYGDVSSAKVVMDRETGRSRGFGFVDMSNDVEAQDAMKTLDGAGIKGKKLAIKQAEEQQRGGGGGQFRPRRDDDRRNNNNRGGRY